MTVQLDRMLSDLYPLLHADTAVDLAFWNPAQLTRWLDQDLKRYAEKGLFIVRATSSMIAGVRTYDTPVRHLSTIHMSNNGQSLYPKSIETLERLDPAFMSVTGTPRFWYTDKIGFNRFGLYPIPDAAAVAADPIVEVVYHTYSQELDGIDIIAVPCAEVVGDALVLAALVEAYGNEGDSQCPEIAAHGMQFLSFYKQAIEQTWGTR